MTQKVVCYGANNPETARMIRACASRQDMHFIGFLDRDPEKHAKGYLGLPVFGGIEKVPELAGQGVRFVNLITRDCLTRYASSRDIAGLGGEFVNLIHPSIDLFMVETGLGNYLQEGVMIQAGCRIGDNSSIHMGSLIGHETVIGSSAFIAHGVAVSGCVSIGDGVFIGAGATIVPRVQIGRWAIIGAGAVVTKDVPDGAVMVGNPAKAIRMQQDLPVNGSPYV